MDSCLKVELLYVSCKEVDTYICVGAIQCAISE